jgi:hypothetical protein
MHFFKKWFALALPHESHLFWDCSPLRLDLTQNVKDPQKV